MWLFHCAILKGAGGWPTVRVFDSASGLEGAPYEKQTDMSMCDELGPKHSYLNDWVAEFANPCSVTDGSGCDERQLKYLNKQKEAGNNETWKQAMERLEKLEAGDMKADLLQWIRQRKKILKSLMQSSGEHSEL